MAKVILDEGRAGHYGAVSVSPLLSSNLQGGCIEGIGTFLLVLTVCAVAFNPRARHEWAPLRKRTRDVARILERHAAEHCLRGSLETGRAGELARPAEKDVGRPSPLRTPRRLIAADHERVDPETQRGSHRDARCAE